MNKIVSLVLLCTLCSSFSLGQTVDKKKIERTIMNQINANKANEAREAQQKAAQQQKQQQIVTKREFGIRKVLEKL